MKTRSTGNNVNNKYKIVILNMKTAANVAGSDFGTFSLQVRQTGLDDNNLTKDNVLEQYDGLNFDPESPSFFARRIGDRYVAIDSNGKLTYHGDWPNMSKYIYVDPDAAKAVFNSGIPIHMAGLEITRQAASKESVIKRIEALNSQAGDFVRAILLFYRSSFLRRHGYDGAPIYDACAVAWLARPELVRSQLMHIDVDHTHTLSKFQLLMLYLVLLNKVDEILYF